MNFEGSISASKSMMNRALLVQSFFPDLKIIGDSASDDVLHMKTAIREFSQSLPIHQPISSPINYSINCGEAGTVLRMMGIRVSRRPGLTVLSGSRRLLSRPQQDLVSILSQLGIRCELGAENIKIQGQGWKKPVEPVKVSREISSQFASGLLLSSWGLDFDLQFSMSGGKSKGYWEMSLELARRLGLVVHQDKDLWTVPAHQKLNVPQIELEPDYSSVFAIAAMAALGGPQAETVTVTNMTRQSLQPDFVFLDLFQKMQIPLQWLDDHTVKFSQASNIRAVDVDLGSCPDLFPVLAVLCAFAKGVSHLSGAAHLVHKESNRIEKTAELLTKAKVKFESKADGMLIHGDPGLRARIQDLSFEYDSDQDHRMAMAAGILIKQGADIRLKNSHSVTKSFPEFWQILGLQEYCS